MVGAGDVAAQVDEGLEPFDLGVDGRAIVREDDLVHAADAEKPAAHTRYTHYNLGELLQPEKAPQAAAR